MRVVLLPPDERPVHRRDPEALAAIAGAPLDLPPADLLPDFHEPGDTDGLARWLRQVGPAADAVVVSVEGLCHGGLVPSRMTDDPVEQVVARLAPLRDLRTAVPSLTVDATAVVTRLPDLDDATEEPEYWASHGADLARWSRALHTGDGIAAARADLPDDVAADLLWRRLRNHTLLLATLALASDGTLDGLVISADDTAPLGLPAREAAWLDGWIAGLAPGHLVERYAGADEVASVRLVRWLRGRAEAPRIHVLDEPGLDRIAPYEGVPIRETARGQVASIGGRVVDDPAAADLVLAVAPPDGDGDWALDPLPDDTDRDAHHLAFADRIAGLVDAGVWVAVADCFLPNGGSPVLVDRLLERGVLARLGAYAGWNTAGNSIGSALAQAVIGRGRGGPGTPHERLLAHRLVEDVGYMTRVRTAVRRERHAAGLPQEPEAVEQEEIAGQIALELGRWLDGLGELGTRWAVDPTSVRLPWGVTFACDLSLEATDG